jgi:hypothetical protein
LRVKGFFQTDDAMLIDKALAALIVIPQSEIELFCREA